MMTGSVNHVADNDPLLQLLPVHPMAADTSGSLVPSQWVALARWPEIARAQGEVSILLRRQGAESEAEWQEALAILAALLDRTTGDIRLLALTPSAAETLSALVAREVGVIGPLPKGHDGPRRLTLSRDCGIVGLTHAGGGPLPARRYNLARLRRTAFFDAAPGEPDLADIATFANGDPSVARPARHRRPTVVVVVPNGTGLGHVTRMLAVANRLRDQRDARVIFWSFSRAAGILSRFGFETILRQTAQHLGAPHEDWRDWETEELAACLTALQPDLVIQDASELRDFVVDALARPGTGDARLVLIRRGMWQKSVLGSTARGSEELADLVLEPGDLAGAADRGVTRGRHAQTDSFARMARSAPVTLTRPEDLLPRRAARRALGIGRGLHCLVSLGGDETGDRQILVRLLVEAAARARVRLFWARSPLAVQDPHLADAATASVYPLAPLLSAFDGVVCAAGYNSFHEAMQLCRCPVLLAPGTASRLDDQAARADHAAAEGWAMTVTDTAGMASTLDAFMADIRAGRAVTTRPDWQDGASEIATELAALIDSGA